MLFPWESISTRPLDKPVFLEAHFGPFSLGALPAWSTAGTTAPPEYLSLAVGQLLHHSNLTFWERDAADLWIKATGGYQH